MSRMSLDNVVSGKQQRPLRISLYGVDGIGKSTFGSNAPSPIFLGAEDGTANLDTSRFPQPQSWADVMDAVGILYTQEHDFKTLVLDTADWAELMAQEAVAAEHNVSSLEEIGYGKGHAFVADKFRDLLRGFDALYGQRNMNIIVLSHAQIEKYNDPEHEPYDRYQLKTSKRVASLIREWCDVNLFANYDTLVKKDGQGFNEKTRAVSYGKRYVYTERRAAFDAKNRYGLPERLPLSWADFWDAYTTAMKN